MALKLNGKAFILHPPSPSVVKLKTYLDKAPKDEIYTPEELGKRSGVSPNCIRSVLGTHEDLADYTHIAGRLRYWGHPVAIKELRKQVGA